MWRGRSCSSITPGRRFLSMILKAGRSARPPSSSPSWGPATTLTPKPPRARNWRTGSVPTSAPSNSGGVPKLVIPDNTRTGVNRACRYEPDLNRTYHELAMHYGVGVLPTRPYKPRDKTWVSYCTSLGFWNNETWLLGGAAPFPFDQLRTLKRFIQGACFQTVITVLP